MAQNFACAILETARHVIIDKNSFKETLLIFETLTWLSVKICETSVSRRQTNKLLPECLQKLRLQPFQGSLWRIKIMSMCHKFITQTHAALWRIVKISMHHFRKRCAMAHLAHVRIIRLNCPCRRMHQSLKCQRF